MENANRTEATELVEGCTALLAPPSDWKPNVHAARARLSARLGQRSAFRRYWMIGAATASVASAAAFVSPSTRAFAQQCWQCVVSLDNRAPAAKVSSTRAAAPDFALHDSQGTLIRLSDYRGKVVLLNFWAPWCAPCRVEIPWFVEFESKYKDSGLAVIGVSLDDAGWKSVIPFIEEQKINYTVVVGDDELARLYGVDAMPITLLIDQEGNVAASHIGLVNKSTFEQEIQALLSERR